MRHYHGNGAFWSTVVLGAVAILYLSKLILASPPISDEETEGTCNYTDSVRQQGETLFYHFAQTSSTQDEAKTILSNKATTGGIPENITTVVVTAAEQTNGRGTNGRAWFSSRGNTFVTVCIRQKAWLDTKLPMTLLPLKVGIVMAERIDELLQQCRRDHVGQQEGSIKDDLLPAMMTTIKWPNDVLVDERKISGVLIESDRDWFLIGIGVNVGHAPQVPTSGANHGRTATCIRDYCSNKQLLTGSSDEYVTMARELGESMARDLSDWLIVHGQDSDVEAQEEQRRMLDVWRGWVDWDMVLLLREGDNKEPVDPIEIESDGRLRVKERGGKERLVVSDYFF